MLARTHGVRRVMAHYAVIDPDDNPLAWFASEADAEDLARRLNGEDMGPAKKDGRGNWGNKRRGQGFDWKRLASQPKVKSR